MQCLKRDGVTDSRPRGNDSEKNLCKSVKSVAKRVFNCSVYRTGSNQCS